MKPSLAFKSDRVVAAGAYSRRLAWKRQLTWARKSWMFLATAVVLPLIVFVPMAYVSHGVARGLVIGASAVGGLWLASFLVLLESGAATAAMGAVAEARIEQDLKSVRSLGWRVVHGIRFPGHGDIDHVAVGPAGILVIEGKWSADAWPLDGSGGFMAGRLARAVSQARTNRRHVLGYFSRDRKSAPVFAVVVVQSPEDPPSGSPKWRDVDGVAVVEGRSFREWLHTLDRFELDTEGVDRISNALRSYRFKQNEAEVEAGEAAPPTLGWLMFRWIGLPGLGVAAALYGFAVVGRSHVWWIEDGELLVSAIVGLVGLRLPRARPFFTGWLAGSCALLVALGILMLSSALHH